MAKFCTKCGAMMQDNDMFCASCGNNMGSPSSQNNGQWNSTQQQQQPQQPNQDFWASRQNQTQQNWDQPQNNAWNQQQQNNWGQQPQQNNWNQPQQNNNWGSQPQAQQSGWNTQPQQGSWNSNQQNQWSAAPAKKKFNPIGIVVFVVLAAIIVGVVFLIKGIVEKIKGLGDELGNLGKTTISAETAGSFNDLCDMTSLGTQSYIYARMITEQLLQTDPVTADPDEVNKLFDKCLDAWKAAEEVSDSMTSMSDSLSSNEEIDKIKANGQIVVTPAPNFFDFGGIGTKVYANAPLPPPTTGIEATLSARESVQQCSVLAAQYHSDCQSGYSAVSSLRSVYTGRSTSVSSWRSSVSSFSSSFSTEVFVTGEITSSSYSVTTGTHSIRTLSNTIKEGTVGINNTDILVDVGSQKSCIVYGSEGSVSMNQNNFGGYTPQENSHTISINSEPPSNREIGITFHRESFFSWFKIDRVGGFTITRGNKGEGTSVVTPPVDPPRVIQHEVDPTGRDEGGIRQGFEEGGFTFPPNTDRPVGELPSVRVNPDNTRIIQQEITNGNNGNNGHTTNGDNNPPDPGSFVSTLNGGVGPITVTMTWATEDDLDLHMDTPNGGHIWYSNKTAQGGTLDIDMNAGEIQIPAAENIYFPDPENGHYKVYLRDFRDRTSGSTHYKVRVKVGNEEKMFEGDIDTSGTEVFIYEFDYGGHGTNSTLTNEPPSGNDMDGRIIATGAASGDITVSLAWNRFDDVDLHMITPDGSHIYYGNKNTGGGTLDVDANAGSQRILDPLENIYFAHPSNGHYKVYIRQYNDRSEDSASYRVRVTVDGVTKEFTGTIDTTGTEIVIYEFDYNGAHDPDTQTFGGHRYQYFDDDTLSWSQARAYCQSIGGHLVTITSQEEQNFINGMFSGKDAWIGAYGDGTTWNWVTGEAWSYTNWRENQPDNANGDEWFAHIWGNGWNDLNDTDSTYHYHHGFICEFDDTPDNGQINIPTRSENGSVTSFGGHTYAFYDTGYTWTEAERYCEGIGGHLVTITSQEEQNFIQQLIADGTRDNYWIGGRQGTPYAPASDDPNVNYSMGPGDWEWVTSESFSYTHWAGSQPDNYFGDEAYAMIAKTALGSAVNSYEWHDIGDNGESPNEFSGYFGMQHIGFICEWDSLNPNDLNEGLREGGAQTGAITISLLWDTPDDLDLHVFAPDGSEICYGNKNAGGGVLDVDANVHSDDLKDNPVENIFFENPANGEYWVYVYDYSDRTEGSATDYLVRVTVGNESETYSGSITNEDDYVEIVGFNYTGGSNGVNTTGGGNSGGNNGTNLLVNGNAENGLDGWRVPNAEWSDHDTSGDNAQPHSGNGFFFAGRTDDSCVYQDVDISAYKGRTITLSAWMAGWQTQGDESYLCLTFLDSSGTKIESYEIQRGSDTSWKKNDIVKTIPSNAQTARVTLRSVRKDGTYNDGYFDDVSLSVS